MRNALAQGIMESAAALGMDPIDLATIISYETAGTFDPTKAGPTTQWGQHRGLIQWGEPQAQQYGVDWSDPMGSQLGADGAIVRYYRDRGWQPGMGMLDAYSIVNAGAPGRYSASDANNGGAPGNVRDKVENQMGGHREKAMNLMGGAYDPGSYQSDTVGYEGYNPDPSPARPEPQGDPRMTQMRNALALMQAFQPRMSQLDPAAFQTQQTAPNALALNPYRYG